MSLTKYIEIVWMNLIGIGFVSIGLYMIMFLASASAIYNPMGFILMVMGLFFSAIGGFYGKKKLLEAGMAQEPVAAVSRQVEQIKQNVVSQLKPMEAAGQAKPQPVVEQPRIQPMLQQPVVQEPQTMEPEQPAQLTGGIIKVMVCPDCNTENSPQNMYCSNCGKRLRAAPLPNKSVKAPQHKKAVKRKQSKPKQQQAQQ